MGIQLSDWYTVTRQDVEHATENKSLFHHYNSLEEALRAAYPQYQWDSSRFTKSDRLTPGHWQNEANLLQALGQAEIELGITKVQSFFLLLLVSTFICKPEDWYSVRLSELREVGFPTVASKLKVAELLARRYPEYHWDIVHLLRGRRAQQQLLERAIASLFEVFSMHQLLCLLTLFQGVEIKRNVRTEAGLINPETNAFFELDIFIPSLNLAFEYHVRNPRFRCISSDTRNRRNTIT